MKRYDYVKVILNEAIDGEIIGRHGAFWRTWSREQFIVEDIYGYLLVSVGDGAGSNIVKALRGEAPFGSDLGVSGATMPRMPEGFPPVPEERIAFIEQWINDGCPDEDMAERG